MIQVHKSIIIYNKKNQQNTFLPNGFHNFHWLWSFIKIWFINYSFSISNFFQIQIVN
jgi:hypothetical protein